eukprot:Awhi_evm1s15201
MLISYEGQNYYEYNHECCHSFSYLVFPIRRHPRKLKAYCPLEKVSVSVDIVDMIAQVQIKQTFYNPSASAIDGTYIFPLDEKSAVCAFEAEVNGDIIQGLVKEKEEAKREFQEAKARGQNAYLLDQKKADVFELNMANLPGHSRINVTTTYLTELKLNNGDITFVLPNSVAPRYSSYRDGYVPSTNKTSQQGLDCHINFSSLSKILKISSETHPITANFQDPKNMTVDLVSSPCAYMEKEFIVNFQTEDPSPARVFLETTDDKSRALMVTLVPQFELDDTKCELVFVVDRSGSMAGKQMENAKAALQLFLRSLPMDCYFNIIGFGSRYTQLFSTSQKFSRDTLQKATKHVQGIGANLGGTELYAPLEYVYSSAYIPGYNRQVFVLTDGQVSNTDRVTGLVRNQTSSGKSRTFALGLGSSVSRLLVEGIARAGLGTAEFVAGDARLQNTVIMQLQNALQPSLSDVEIDWGVKPKAKETVPATAAEAPMKKTLLGYKKPNAVKTIQQQPNVVQPLQQAPYKTPPILSNTRFLSYLILRPDEPTPTKVTIKANTPDGPLEVELDIEEDNKIEGDMVHKMAARNLIRDLEESSSYMHLNRAYFALTDDDVKRQIIRLGCTWGLSSKHTSFIAVDKRIHASAPTFTPTTSYVAYDVQGSCPPPPTTPSSPMAPGSGFYGGAPPAYSSNSFAAAPPPPPGSAYLSNSFTAAPPPPGPSYSMSNCAAPAPSSALFGAPSASYGAAPARLGSAPSAPRPSASRAKKGGRGGARGGAQFAQQQHHQQQPCFQQQQQQQPCFPSQMQSRTRRSSDQMHSSSESAEIQNNIMCFSSLAASVDDCEDDLEEELEGGWDDCDQYLSSKKEKKTESCKKKKSKNSFLSSSSFSSSAPSLKAKSSGDVVTDIVMFQDFDGSFPDCQGLSHIVGCDYNLILKSCPEYLSGNRDLSWFTAIACFYMKIILFQNETELRLVIAKGLSFLKQTLGQNLLSQVTQDAETFVKTQMKA